MAISDKDFYASHGISFDIEKMQIEYTKRVIRQAKIEVLTELKSEIEQMTPTYHYPNWYITDLVSISEVNKVIQQKINTLKGEENVDTDTKQTKTH